MGMYLGDMYTIYVKPSIGGQVILRKPRNRPTTSAAVKAQRTRFSEKMKGKRIASACKGKKGTAFFGCLRTQGQAAWK